MDGWKYIKAEDAISGKEGALYATIDGSVFQVAECKKIDSKITKKKVDFKALGYRGTQHKATGWDGTGTMVVHYVTSKWKKMMIEYAKTGKDQYFQLQVINEDPTSKIGRQTVTLLDVNINECDVAKLDTEADFLDETISFTFSGVDMPEEFADINV